MKFILHLTVFRPKKIRSIQLLLPEFYLWLEDDVTLTSSASKDDGEEDDKEKEDISTHMETN